MEGASNGGMLYHEVQESKLCAVHCVNTVLQGPFFSEFDLAALASDLDCKERQVLLEGGASAGGFLAEDSHNVSLGGDFSIQPLLPRAVGQCQPLTDFPLAKRQTTVHQILGGGLVADVILWRRKNVTMNILWLTLAAWVVFQRSGYTLLSFVSSVCLLLFTILFLWSKSAAILNRPAPPLPELYLSEEMVNEAAALIRNHVNVLLSRFQDIALGKDSRLFFRVALYLLFIYIVGGLTDFLTLGYATLVITLTIPALYERYEDHIDSCIMIVYRKLLRCYYRFDVVCLMPIRGWMLEKKKLS